MINPVIVRFGRFRFDVSRRILERDGEPLPLPRQTFACLRCLIESRDRAVSREDLIRAIWNRDNVSDAQLSNLMLRVRRLLGDEGDTQAIIRTVVGFGYAWAAATQVEDDPQPLTTAMGPELDASPETTTVPMARDRMDVDRRIDDATERSVPGEVEAAAPQSPRAVRAGSVTLLVALLMMAVLVWSAGDGGSVEQIPTAAVSLPPATQRLAVLPLQVQPIQALPWAKLGGMDLLTERLRRSGLLVMSTESVLALLHGDPDVDEASRRLRALPEVDTLISGSLRQVNDDWLVLLEADTGSLQLLGEGRDSDPLLALETATSQLLAALGRNAMGAHGDPELIALIQRARAALLAEAPDEARQLLAQAPPAWRDLPELRFHLAQIETRAGQPDQAMAILDGLLAEPTTLDDDRLRILVHVARGVARFRLGQHALALADFDAAIAVPGAPAHPYALGEAYNGQGVVYIQRGRRDEATKAFARARTLLEETGDVSAVARVDANMGMLDYQRGRYASAQQRFDQLVEHQRLLGNVRGQVSALYMLVEIHLAQLTIDDALAAGERAWALASSVGDRMLWRALALQRVQLLTVAGRFSAADEVLAQLVNADIPHAEAVRDHVRLANAGLELALRRGDVASLRQWLSHPAPEPDAVGPTQEGANLVARLFLLRQRARVAVGESVDGEPPPGTVAANGQDGSFPDNPSLLLALAEWYWQSGDHRHADAAYQHLLARVQENGSPQEVVDAASSRIQRLVAAGRVDEAAIVASQIAGWADQHFDSALARLHLAHAQGSARAWQAALGVAERLAGEHRIPAHLRDPAPFRAVAGTRSAADAP